MKFVNRGEFGGAGLKDKLHASIERQKSLMEFVTLYDINRLVCLCSVDANRVAFGLGIPVVNFYDIPLSDYNTNFKKLCLKLDLLCLYPQRYLNLLLFQMKFF